PEPAVLIADEVHNAARVAWRGLENVGPPSEKVETKKIFRPNRAVTRKRQAPNPTRIQPVRSRRPGIADESKTMAIEVKHGVVSRQPNRAITIRYNDKYVSFQTRRRDRPRCYLAASYPR